MNPKIKLELKPITEESLVKKFGIAFIFMSLVPIILILFIVYMLNMAPLLEEQMPYLQLTILFVVLLSLASFDLLRRSMNSFVKFAKSAKQIVNGKLYHKRLEVDSKDEIGLLEESFNKITAELEAKIKDLQESKGLLQDILLKIGNAVTSTKGIDNLLELIIESLAKGIEADSGAIFLLNGSTDHLTMKVSFGVDEELKYIRIKASEGLIGRVIRLKKPEMVADIGNNAASYVEFKNRLARYSMIAVPLLFKGRVLGVITMSDKKEKDSFDNDDIILLTNVAAQTAVAIENYQLNEDAEKTYIETITALAVAVEARDPYSRGHLDRVTGYVEKLGNRLQLDDEMMKLLRNGATLHDIGKIGIRDDILRKVGSLSNEEEKEMRKHVIIGVNIIKPIRSMAALCDVVRHHQEFYDGSGYPSGLRGEEIPLAARILKVCDAYDAMITDRPYHKAMSKEEARQELQAKSGSEFDAKIIEEFLKVI